MYAAVETRHESAWGAFYEGGADQLTRRDLRMIRRVLTKEACRLEECVAEVMGGFSEEAEEWAAWVRELKAVEEPARENVSFWPSDVPEPPAEPEGLWEHLQEKKSEDLEATEEKEVAFCLLYLALARARRGYQEQGESP